MWLGLAAATSCASACPLRPEAEVIATARSEEAEARRLVARRLAQADEVFVGRLLSLERAPDRGDFAVRFEPLRVIKGAPRAGAVYRFERGEKSIPLGCSSLAGTNDISFDEGPGYRYLVYAEAGVVVRANLVVDWFDGLSSEVELEMIGRALERDGGE